MNIDEEDQTYLIISRTDTDNLISFFIQFLTTKSFHFHNERIPLHMTLDKCNV